MYVAAGNSFFGGNLKAAGQAANFAPTIAPTTDIVTITNAGLSVTTAGVSALQVTYAGGAAAVEASAARIDMTPGTTTGGTWNGWRFVGATAATTGVTMNALKIDSITTGLGTDNALYVGTGYDNIINYNGTTIIDGTGQIPKLTNGNSNITIVANANVNISSTGVANVLVVTGTGANIAGTANITGNLSAGNIPLITSGTSNITLASSANISAFIGGNATAQLVVTATGANIPGTANVTGLITGGNVTTTGANGTVTANNHTITGAASGIPNVATVTGNLGLRSIASTYTDTSAAATVANAAIHAIATPTLIGSNAMTYTNLSTLYIQSNPTASTNATATNSYALFVGSGNSFFGGNIIGVHANGNSNVNIPAANGNVNISAVGNANVLVVTGTGANVTGTGNFTGNLTAAAHYGPLANTTSNVSIPAAAGNVNISVGGTANVLVLTATGANIPGTANVVGLITGGNISTTGANGTAQANNFTATGVATGNANVSTVTGNLGIRAISTTYTDNSAAATGTITLAAAHAIATPTYAAANATVTATNAATFYIQAQPTAGTNLTLGNAWAMYVGAGNSYFGGNVRVTAGGITSNNSTAGVGYAAGAGSTGTQATNRNTAVAMTAPCVSGSITLFSTTTLANTWNNFAVSNVVCTTSDVVILNMRSGGSLNSYTFDIVSVGSNTFTIQIYNAVAVVAGEAPVLGFAIIKGATA